MPVGFSLNSGGSMTNTQIEYLKKLSIRFQDSGFAWTHEDYFNLREIVPEIYRIGDYLKDEDGNVGVVCIRWNDGDLCSIENDAAHPNPKKYKD